MTLSVYVQNNFLVLKEGINYQYIVQSDSDFEDLNNNPDDIKIFDTKSRTGKRSSWQELVGIDGVTPIGSTKIEVIEWLTLNAGDKSNTGGSTGGNVEGLLNEISDKIAIDLNPNYVTQQPVMRTNINVPSGFRSVTIMRLGGNVTINCGDGTNELGGGQNPRAITLEGDIFGNRYGILPEIVITGGTWQWVANNQI